MAESCRNRTTVSDQGSIAIPTGIRKELGIGKGDEIEWIIEDGEIKARKVKERDPDEIMVYIKNNRAEIKKRKNLRREGLERAEEEWAIKNGTELPV